VASLCYFTLQFHQSTYIQSGMQLSLAFGWNLARNSRIFQKNFLIILLLRHCGSPNLPKNFSGKMNTHKMATRKMEHRKMKNCKMDTCKMANRKMENCKINNCKMENSKMENCKMNNCRMATHKMENCKNCKNCKMAGQF
jgi:hypothetical protein